MSFEEVDNGTHVVLVPEGKFNLVAAPPIKARIDDLVGAGRTRIVVDMHAVDFIDSSGLGALIGGLKSARQQGGDVRIAAAGAQRGDEFDLVVQVPGGRRIRQHAFGAVGHAQDGVGGLGEEERRVAVVAAHLAPVGGVVAADAEDAAHGEESGLALHRDGGGRGRIRVVGARPQVGG